MIVKIQHKDGWIFYDSFVKIHYEKQTVTGHEYKNYDANWSDEVSKNNKNYVSIVGRLRDNTEFTIASFNTTYLLNDLGKTIERIN